MITKTSEKKQFISVKPGKLYNFLFHHSSGRVPTQMAKIAKNNIMTLFKNKRQTQFIDETGTWTKDKIVSYGISNLLGLTNKEAESLVFDGYSGNKNGKDGVFLNGENKFFIEKKEIDISRFLTVSKKDDPALFPFSPLPSRLSMLLLILEVNFSFDIHASRDSFPYFKNAGKYEKKIKNITKITDIEKKYYESFFYKNNWYEFKVVIGNNVGWIPATAGELVISDIVDFSPK